jgi:hypothetical protein
MLLGIVGMYALGKTTWLEKNRDAWPELLKPGISLVCVSADNAYEYWYDKRLDCWSLRSCRDNLWKRTHEEKADHLAGMIMDERTIWIVESARYILGMQDEILQAHKVVKGGVRFIVPWAKPDACKIFIQKRCEKRNKKFNVEYWDYKRLEYEGAGRYHNLMKRHYLDVGIPTQFVMVDLERKSWIGATSIVNRWVAEAPEGWYK